MVDTDTEREKDRADVRDGLMLPWEYRVKWYGETEEKARATLDKNNISSDDDIMGFANAVAEPEPNPEIKE